LRLGFIPSSLCFVSPFALLYQNVYYSVNVAQPCLNQAES
jgi:hypothetical protein